MANPLIKDSNNFSYLNFSNYPKVQNILKKSMEVLNLNSLDLYTITDLIEYSGIEDEKLIMILTTILAVMFDSLQNGSICLKLDNKETINRINLITESFADSKKILDTFNIQKDVFKEITGFNDKDYKPLIYKEYQDIPHLYFQKYFIAEKKLKEELNHLTGNQDLYDISKVNFDVLKSLKDSNLNNKQRLAVYLAIIKNFVIISGGPGTGKTHIIYQILKLLIKCGYDISRIKLGAPTGRASQKLTESIKSKIDNEDDIQVADKLKSIQGETIHRILKYSINKNDFIYNENNLLPADVVIIDEVSMVDIILMTKLLSALSKKIKLIFLGDKNQIPSVEAGAVLAELIPFNYKEEFSDVILALEENINTSKLKSKMTDRIIVLNDSYRSVKNILEISEEINNQNMNVINKFTKLSKDALVYDFNNKPDCVFLESSSHQYHDFKEILKKWIDNYYLLNNNYMSLIEKIKKIELEKDIKGTQLLDDLFNTIENNKILCIIKEGFFGINSINEYIIEKFAEKTAVYNKKYFSGLPVIVLENDYTKNLFNGDCGIIIKDKTNQFKAVFKKNNQYAFYSTDFLPLFDYGFAITVHKSQGSEYNDILIILPDNIDNPLLTKEILYTGITRAKSSIIIYGKENILIKTITKKIIRQAGINLWV